VQALFKQHQQWRLQEKVALCLHAVELLLWPLLHAVKLLLLLLLLLLPLLPHSLLTCTPESLPALCQTPSSSCAR
jgi:hypothetical protein